jgi:membrane protein
LNCELERQTAEDTTTGAARPMGDRNAYAADTVASGSAAVHPGPKQAEPAGPVREAARGYALTRVVPARSGLVPTLLVTGGLALLRRRGRAGAGAALLAAGGTISFLRRR